MSKLKEPVKDFWTAKKLLSSAMVSAKVRVKAGSGKTPESLYGARIC